MNPLPLPARSLCAVGLYLAATASASPETSSGCPPVADAGGPYVVECQGGLTVVQLDATGSSSPCGGRLEFTWKSECPAFQISEPHSPTPLLIVSGQNLCGATCPALILTVHSAGQSSKVTTTVTIQDTRSPGLKLPGDVFQPWGIDTTTAGTGYATASDACSPNPTLTYSDIFYAPAVEGVERVIERTWLAVDACGNRTAKVQKIHLLKPSAGGFNLELDPLACSDTFLFADPNPALTLWIAGIPKLEVGVIVPSSLRFSVRENPSGSLQTAGIGLPGIADFLQGMAQSPQQCNPSGQDGRPDVPIVLDRERMRSTMGLLGFLGGPPLLLTVAGQRIDGSWFWAQTTMTVE